MWFILNLLQALFIISFTVLTIFLAMPPALIGFPRVAYFLGRHFWAPPIIFIVGGKINVIGKENIDPSKTYIYSANHASNFDIPILFKSIPVDLHFIAKKELKKIPLFGWCMSAMKMIFIDRKNRASALASMKKGGELIKEGNNVITFPEGKRSRSGKIEMFRKGTFVIAKEAQIDIIPIAIVGSARLQKPGGIEMRPGTVTVVIGSAVEAKNYLDKTPEEFANDVQEKVVELFNSQQR